MDRTPPGDAQNQRHDTRFNPGTGTGGYSPALTARRRPVRQVARKAVN
jgi:hypothetical protein